MFPFTFSKATDERAALAEGSRGGRFIAGGTTLIDLMRETVERPPAVVDITALPYRNIDVRARGLLVGSLVTMTDLAAHPEVRSQFPVISQGLPIRRIFRWRWSRWTRWCMCARWAVIGRCRSSGSSGCLGVLLSRSMTCGRVS